MSVVGDILSLDAELAIGLIGRNGHRAFELTEPIGSERVGSHLLAFVVVERDLEQSVGQCLFAVDTHLTAQYRIVDSLVRAIDSEVGQDLYLFLRIVFRLLEIPLLLVFLSDKSARLGIDKDLESRVEVGMIDNKIRRVADFKSLIAISINIFFQSTIDSYLNVIDTYRQLANVHCLFVFEELVFVGKSHIVNVHELHRLQLVRLVQVGIGRKGIDSQDNVVSILRPDIDNDRIGRVELSGIADISILLLSVGDLVADIVRPYAIGIFLDIVDETLIVILVFGKVFQLEALHLAIVKNRIDIIGTRTLVSQKIVERRAETTSEVIAIDDARVALDKARTQVCLVGNGKLIHRISLFTVFVTSVNI